MITIFRATDEKSDSVSYSSKFLKNLQQKLIEFCDAFAQTIRVVFVFVCIRTLLEKLFVSLYFSLTDFSQFQELLKHFKSFGAIPGYTIDRGENVEINYFMRKIVLATEGRGVSKENRITSPEPSGPTALMLDLSDAINCNIDIINIQKMLKIISLSIMIWKPLFEISIPIGC